jgi:hypothetical protein
VRVKKGQKKTSGISAQTPTGFRKKNYIYCQLSSQVRHPINEEEAVVRYECGPGNCNTGSDIQPPSHL